MVNRMCLALGGLLLAAPARAYFSGGMDQTFGNNNYKGTGIYAEVGDKFYVSPSFSSYNSDLTTGTFTSYNLRFGWDAGPFSFGLGGGAAPKNNGYKNNSFGGDVTFTFTPTGKGKTRRLAGPDTERGAFGAGLARVDVGGGINIIRHSDDIVDCSRSGSGSGEDCSGGRFPDRLKGAALIRQTDVSLFAGASFLMTEASIHLTKSNYDADLAKVQARASQKVQLQGLLGTIQGFPKASTHLKLSWSMLPVIIPYLSYTYTTFELSDPASKSLGVGATAGLGMLQVKASYETYNPGGGVAKLNYFSLGAGLRF